MKKNFAMIVLAVLAGLSMACGSSPSGPSGVTPTPAPTPSPAAVSTITTLSVSPAQGTSMSYCCHESTDAQVRVRYTLVGDYTSGLVLLTSYMSIDGVNIIFDGSEGNGAFKATGEFINQPSIGRSTGYNEVITQTGFVITRLEFYPSGKVKHDGTETVIAQTVYPWVFNWPGKV